MSASDYAAWFGAFAWLLPLAVSYFIKKYKKSKVRILTQDYAELGFTSFGPIFNINLAFFVKDRDLVISSIKIKVRHENGLEKLFVCRNIRQTLMVKNSKDGDIPYEKENSVLAIKLNEKDVEERLIQTYEKSFNDGIKEFEKTFWKSMSFASKNDGYSLQDFLKNSESNDLFNFIRQQFDWKAGKYFVEIGFDAEDNFELQGEKYEFSLSPMDIEQLEENKEWIKHEYSNSFYNEDSENFVKFRYTWIYPKLFPVKN